MFVVFNMEGVGGFCYILKVCKDENIYICIGIIFEVFGGNMKGVVF